MLIDNLRNSKAAKLFVMDYGLFQVHSNGRIIGIQGFLIQTDDGKSVLVDTGFSEKYIGRIEEASREDRLDEFGKILKLERDNFPTGQLAKIGLTPDDIDILIITHTHIDHVGGIEDFTHVPMVISRAERAMDKPLYWHDVQPYSWPEEVDYVLTDGDIELFPGVWMLAVPGHTPGQTALLVDLPSTGSVILTSDTISRPSEIEEGFSGCWDNALADKNARRLMAIAAEKDAFVIYGHCPEQWPTLKKAPEYYN